LWQVSRPPRCGRSPDLAPAPPTTHHLPPTTPSTHQFCPFFVRPCPGYVAKFAWRTTADKGPEQQGLSAYDRLTLPKAMPGSLTGFPRKIRGFLTWPGPIWQCESRALSATFISRSRFVRLCPGSVNALPLAVLTDKRPPARAAQAQKAHSQDSDFRPEMLKSGLSLTCRPCGPPGSRP
jgi:hypothetical protein